MAKQCATITIEEKPKPNLVVTSIDVPNTGTAGESFDVTVTVANKGEASGSGTLKITVDGDVVNRGDVSLPAGRSTKLGYSITIQETGDHRVCGSVS